MTKSTEPTKPTKLASPETLDIQPPQTVEEMTETQIDEILDRATYLTMYQLDMLLTAASHPNRTAPLWGHPKIEAFMANLTFPVHYAAEYLEEIELRELLQRRELEAQKLIRMVTRDKKAYWQLTARGHLVVIWHLRTLTDYQFLIPTIDSE